jgi:hypothetical protein
MQFTEIEPPAPAMPALHKSTGDFFVEL